MQGQRLDPPTSPAWYTFQTTLRTVLLTLNTGLLIAVVIEAYINTSWDTSRVIIVIITSMNILRFVFDKPRSPEIKPEIKNDDFQSPGQTPQGN